MPPKRKSSSSSQDKASKKVMLGQKAAARTSQTTDLAPDTMAGSWKPKPSYNAAKEAYRKAVQAQDPEARAQRYANQLLLGPTTNASNSLEGQNTYPTGPSEVWPATNDNEVAAEGSLAVSGYNDDQAFTYADLPSPIGACEMAQHSFFVAALGPDTHCEGGGPQTHAEWNDPILRVAKEEALALFDARGSRLYAEKAKLKLPVSSLPSKPVPVSFPPPALHEKESRPTQNRCVLCRWNRLATQGAVTSRATLSGCKDCEVALCASCFAPFHGLE